MLQSGSSSRAISRHPLLVRGMEKREQEADRDRFESVRGERPQGFAQRRLVERAQHLALMIDALLHLAGEALRHQQRRLVVHHVEDGGPVGARLLAHRIDAAKAFRHQEAGLDALAFQQRVGADGGAVAEKPDVGGRDALGEQHLDALQDGARRVVGGRGHLADGDLAGLLVEIDEIRERPAGIDRDAVAGHRDGSGRRWRRAAERARRRLPFLSGGGSGRKDQRLDDHRDRARGRQHGADVDVVEFLELEAVDRHDGVGDAASPRADGCPGARPRRRRRPAPGDGPSPEYPRGPSIAPLQKSSSRRKVAEPRQGTNTATGVSPSPRSRRLSTPLMAAATAARIDRLASSAKRRRDHRHVAQRQRLHGRHVDGAAAHLGGVLRGADHGGADAFGRGLEPGARAFERGRGSPAPAARRDRRTSAPRGRRCIPRRRPRR